jgi:hypothetical protein
MNVAPPMSRLLHRTQSRLSSLRTSSRRLGPEQPTLHLGRADTQRSWIARITTITADSKTRGRPCRPQPARPVKAHLHRRSHSEAAASRSRLTHEAVVTKGGASPYGPRWSQRRNRIPGSSSAAVPLACHSQRSCPVPSGQSRTTPEPPRPGRLTAFAGDDPARSGFGSRGRCPSPTARHPSTMAWSSTTRTGGSDHHPIGKMGHGRFRRASSWSEASPRRRQGHPAPARPGTPRVNCSCHSGRASTTTSTRPARRRVWAQSMRRRLGNCGSLELPRLPAGQRQPTARPQQPQRLTRPLLVDGRYTPIRQRGERYGHRRAQRSGGTPGQ